MRAREGEAFGEAYELPNAHAYGESCAAIGNMMWNWRMLAASGEAKFTDVIERALYNGINSGMSLDGTLYCYRNPLAFDPIRRRQDSQSVVRHDLLSAESGAHVRVSAGIFLQHQQRRNLRAPLRQFRTGLASGERHRPEDRAEDELSLGRDGRNHGHARAASNFTFHLRIPGWAESAQVTVNDKPVTGAKPGQYLPIERKWSAGDVIRLRMEMPTQVIRGEPPCDR